MSFHSDKALMQEFEEMVDKPKGGCPSSDQTYCDAHGDPCCDRTMCPHCEHYACQCDYETLLQEG